MTKAVVTKHGAFNVSDRKPGEMTKEGAMPDIFKFERTQAHVLEEPILRIHNESLTWDTSFKISEAPKELIALMMDHSKIYMICLPAPKGLQPLQMISTQTW